MRREGKGSRVGVSSFLLTVERLSCVRPGGLVGPLHCFQVENAVLVGIFQCLCYMLWYVQRKIIRVFCSLRAYSLVAGDRPVRTLEMLREHDVL